MSPSTKLTCSMQLPAVFSIPLATVGPMQQRKAPTAHQAHSDNVNCTNAGSHQRRTGHSKEFDRVKDMKNAEWWRGKEKESTSTGHREQWKKNHHDEDWEKRRESSMGLEKGEAAVLACGWQSCLAQAPNEAALPLSVQELSCLYRCDSTFFEKNARILHLGLGRRFRVSFVPLNCPKHTFEQQTTPNPSTSYA